MAAEIGTAKSLDVARVRASVRKIGKQFDPQVIVATQALYLELQRKSGRSGARLLPDLRYGQHPLQNFDLFLPEAPAAGPRATLVYLHGGGFVAGDKVAAGTDGLLYGNVGYFAARNGLIGVNANYRLAPDVKWPGGAEDIRLLMQWLAENLAQHGGDPDRIFLMGNSAGSTHVASYLFHGPSQFEDGPRVAGALLSSGAFEAGDAEVAIAYYGAEPAARAAHSPLGLVDAYAGPAVPLFLWSAEFDPAFIEISVAEFYAKLCAKYRACPRYAQFQGHNHVSHIMSINTADTEVGDAVLDFIANVLAAR